MIWLKIFKTWSLALIYFEKMINCENNVYQTGNILTCPPEPYWWVQSSSSGHCRWRRRGRWGASPGCSSACWRAPCPTCSWSEPPPKNNQQEQTTTSSSIRQQQQQQQQQHRVQHVVDRSHHLQTINKSRQQLQAASGNNGRQMIFFQTLPSQTLRIKEDWIVNKIGTFSFFSLLFWCQVYKSKADRRKIWNDVDIFSIVDILRQNIDRDWRSEKLHLPRCARLDSCWSRDCLEMNISVHCTLKKTKKTLHSQYSKKTHCTIKKQKNIAQPKNKTKKHCTLKKQKKHCTTNKFNN